MTTMSDKPFDLAKGIRDVSARHDLYTIWCDWLQMTATALANAVEWDKTVWQQRENEYLKTVGRYDKKEVERMVSLYHQLVAAFPTPGCDLLGQVYMALELGDKWKGQFFTPDDVCSMMAQSILDREETQRLISERGYVTLSEPSVGGGATVIGFANKMRELGFNYQRNLHVTAVDIDIKSVHMAYIQLTIMGIPAVIVHGNTLTLQEWSHWITPMHVMGNWDYKLKRRK